MEQTTTEIEETPFQIPEKYRVSNDPNDQEAYFRLALSDANQRILAEKVNAPFVHHSSKDRERANALITIKEYERIADYQILFPNQKEELADAYASVGLYKRAAETTLNPLKREEFQKYEAAVWLDDADWCQHGERHKFIKEMVWSVREGREMPLLACNECGTYNVKDAPERLLAASRQRAEIREAYKKMSAPEFTAFMEKFKRKS